MSQFWYNDETKRRLADASLRILEKYFDKSSSIGLLSSPSLYENIKSLHENVVLFEFDDRFQRYGSDFVQYDYKNADNAEYLKEYHGKFDLLLLDPPFLSEECMEKMSKICRNLLKSHESSKVILCSGKTVQPFAEKYMSLQMCAFEPQHERNLGNDFASYANFDLDQFIKP